MANFYTEVPELKFQLNNPMMERICELKERGYQDKDKFDYAPLMIRFLKSPEKSPERLSTRTPKV